MPSVHVNINKSYKKNNGQCAVYLVVHLNYKTVRFNTSVTVDPEKFDEQKGRVKGNTKDVKDANLIIEQCLARMNDIFVMYRLQNFELSAEVLKKEWINPTRRIDFYVFLDETIKERSKELAHGTIAHHKSVLTKLKKFRPELSFSEINCDLIEDWRRWLRNKEKNDTNTIHSNLKILKAYLNIAVRKEIIKTNPFNRIKLQLAKVDRVNLTADELNDCWQLYKSGSLTAAKQSILRHFLFMCFTGIRISDFKKLTRENIVNDFLIYNVHKTKNIKKNMIKVPLAKFALQLIEDERSRTNLLFNSISEQKMNEFIKKICESIGIDKAVTNHSARHTFATLWLDQTNDLAALQQLLGHSSIVETMMYVHVTDAHTKKQMKIFEKILPK